MVSLNKSRIFLVICLAYILGVFLGKFINFQIMAMAAMIFIIALTVFWQNKTVFIFAIAGVVAIAGSARFKSEYVKNDIAIYYNQTIEIMGVVVKEPDVRPDKTYLTLGQIEINSQQIESKILLTMPKYREFDYGEKFKFKGKIQEPKEYPDFSYKNYLSRFGIDAVVYMPAVESIEGQYGNQIMSRILQIKKKFIGALDQNIREPQSSLLSGLLLGAKKSIPENLTEQFNRTGTSHIVAVSGYNISIIAIGIEWLLQWFGLRKRISFFLSIFLIIMFVIMTGASASVIRAGIMGSLLLLALNIGRLGVAANSLAFTASVMLLINPLILLFDVGFQLSFSAIIGIIYLTPSLSSVFKFLPTPMRQYFLATLAAQIFTLPILLYYFGTLSVVALIPNLLILPMIPLTMLFGFMTGILSWIWIDLASPMAYVTSVLLSYILAIIDFFANLSFATISWHINVIAVISYYVILLGILAWHHVLNESLHNREFLLEYSGYESNK